MIVERISWGGWSNCVRISNDHIELIVTTDVGPRVIYAGLTGKGNVFHVNEAMLGRTGGDKWLSYGGHRLWHAPEDAVRTYYPDNHAVEVITKFGEVQFVAPVETTTGIQKTVHIRLGEGADVTVQHVMKNHNLWDVTLSLWALSVMRAGGVSVIPLPPRGTHPEELLPNTQLIFWPYADLSDPRWTFGREFLLLRQDAQAETPQKMGGLLSSSWLGYVNDGVLFVKHFDYDAQASYPDMGCNAEVFTNRAMLELETLSPLYTIAPQATVTHVERWQLFDGVPTPTHDDDVKQHILPKIDIES